MLWRCNLFLQSLKAAVAQPETISHRLLTFTTAKKLATAVNLWERQSIFVYTALQHLPKDLFHLSLK